MDRERRNRIQRATQDARALLEREYPEQLAGTCDIRLDRTVAVAPGDHLDAGQRLVRAQLVTAIEHLRAAAHGKDAVAAYVREAAFTNLNRFVVLKMLEARRLVQQYLSRGKESSGFKEFIGLGPGLVPLPDHGFRLYVERLFDEIGREVRVLFDCREDAARGLGVIDLCGQHYDVVLMNRPFDAFAERVRIRAATTWPGSKNDIYAASVERGVRLLHPHGRLGAITSRTGFFLSWFDKWREDLLPREPPPVLVADPGHGVMVRATAYCLEVAA